MRRLYIMVPLFLIGSLSSATVHTRALANGRGSCDAAEPQANDARDGNTANQAREEAFRRYHDAIIAVFERTKRLIVHPDSTNISPPSVSTFLNNGSPIERTLSHCDECRSLDTLTTLDTSLHTLWPGAIVDGQSLSQSHPRQISLPRSPITVTVNNFTLANPATQCSAKIDTPAYSTVTTAIHRLIATGLSNSSQSVVTTEFTFDSLDQALLRLGIPPSMIGASEVTSLEPASFVGKTNVAVCLKKTLYSVCVDYPGDAAAFFYPSITIDTLSSSIGPITPAYISSVAYGQLVLVLASSDAPADALRHSLNDLLQWQPVPALPLPTNERSILQNSRLTVIVLGGSPATTVGVSAKDKLTSFASSVKAINNESPVISAVPISYSLRYLTDDSRLSLSFPVSFDIVRDRPILPEEYFAPNKAAVNDMLVGKPKMATVADSTITTSHKPKLPPRKDVRIENDKSTGDDYQVESVDSLLSANVDAIVGLDTNVDEIWPGAILRTDGLNNPDRAQVRQVALPRRSGKLTLLNLTSADPKVSYSVSVPNADQSTIVDAVQGLLHQNIVKGTPARLSFDQRECYSLEQGLLSLGMSASYLGSSAKASLKTENDVTRNNVIASLLQSYYTVSFEYPGSASGFFDPRVTATDLRRQLESAPDRNDVSAPVYVSAVTYGRLLLLSVSSTETAKDVEEALSASVNLGIAGGSASLSDTEKSVLKNSEIRIVAIGGPSANVALLMGADKSKALQDYIAQGADVTLASGGVPISFAMRYLSDNSLARIGFQTDYDEQVRTKIGRKLASITVRLYTESDDKDAGDIVSVSIAKGSHLVGEVDRVGGPAAASTWGDQDSTTGGRPHEATMSNLKGVHVEDAAQLMLTVDKGGSGNGWKFSVMVIGTDAIGNQVVLLNRTSEQSVGSNPRFRTFKLGQ